MTLLLALIVLLLILDALAVAFLVLILPGQRPPDM